jgi:hypothetical protein
MSVTGVSSSPPPVAPSEKPLPPLPPMPPLETSSLSSIDCCSSIRTCFAMIGQFLMSIFSLLMNCFKKPSGYVEMATDCSICTEKLTTPVGLECGHAFDHHCILRWFVEHKAINTKCPICNESAEKPLKERVDLIQKEDLIELTITYPEKKPEKLACSKQALVTSIIIIALLAFKLSGESVVLNVKNYDLYTADKKICSLGETTIGDYIPPSPPVSHFFLHQKVKDLSAHPDVSQAV